MVGSSAPDKPLFVKKPPFDKTQNNEYFKKQMEEKKEIEEKKKQKEEMDKKIASMPMLPIAYTTPYVPPQFQNKMQEMFQNYARPFIYKDYNIYMNGLNDDHMMAQRVFEDILPSTDIYASFLTLRERNALCGYIRSTFINEKEGEYKNFSGDNNSLNARLKLLELTPYKPNNNLTKNMHKDRPRNMLLYSSCYPIKYSEKTNNCDCAEKNVNINLRVYNLSVDELEFFEKNIEDDKRKSEILLSSNIIREMKYYEFIRKEINRFNYCPNFVQSYCYFICKNCNINFNKENTNKKSNTCLMLLTEGPDSNIIQWASNKTKNDKNLVKQTDVGFKSEKTWKSILFQMIIVFYTMEKKLFTFTDMTLVNNFYIKKISSETSDTQKFIRYVVNNVDYYIENCGYLLLCNSDYHDLITNDTMKIISKEFKNTDVEIKENTRINACICLGDILSSNNPMFCEPPEKIKSTIQGIMDDIQKETKQNISSKFEEILLKYFGGFFHNRVGGSILDAEKNYGKMEITDENKLIKGNLYLKKDNNEFVIFYCIDPISNEYLFINNKNNGLHFEKINIDNIYFMGSNIEIKQLKETNTLYLTSDNIIETYYLK